MLVLSTTGVALAGGAAASTPPTNVFDKTFDELLEIKVDIVSSASGFEQPITRAPSSVSIVTRNEISKQGYRTLAEVLRSVNGIFVTDDRNYSYIGMRGFNRPGDYNSRLLLLVNGHRMNGNIYEEGLYGTGGFLDVDTIERVEVVRGPSSSLYGNNAFFGVVNVVTRPGGSINGFEVTAEGGGQDTYKTGIHYGRLFRNGAELMISGSFYDTAGEGRIFFPEFNTPAQNNGFAQDSDHDRASHVFGSLGYRDFTLSGGWALREKLVPTASYGTAFNDGGELTTDERAYVDLKWEHEFSETVKLMGRAAYDWNDHVGEYPFTFLVDPRLVDFNVARGEWFDAEWQLNWRVAERHTLVFGADYREQLELHQSNYTVDRDFVWLDDDRDGHNAGVFGQAELSLTTNLFLNAGVRFDHYSTFGGTVNPRLALIYNPWTPTTFKLLYGEAFRAPNAYELFYRFPGQAKANPALEPETIRTYEAVWEQALPANLRFRVSGYYEQIRNLLSQDRDPADGLLVFQNIAGVQAQGMELDLEGRYVRGLVARLGYALQRTEDETTGERLSNSPEHMAKLNLILPLWQDKLFAGLDLHYYSPVSTLSGVTTDGVFLANATLFSQKLVKNLEVSASIYNLFDERQGFAARPEHRQDTLPQPGRTFRIKLTYRF